jgi:DNA invertase Pin-like site-specific DNA recombinase
LRESRQQLNWLIADAQQRKFDAVLVWKIDRFGRSLKPLVNVENKGLAESLLTGGN